MHKRALYEGQGNLIIPTQASDWEPGNWEKLTLNQGLRFGGEGGIRTPVTLPGKLDFEILPDRQRRQPQTKTNRETQLSPTLAFVSFCQLLSVVLSQFFHNHPSTHVDNSEPPSRIDQARLLRPDRLDSHIFSLTSNQVPRVKSLQLRGFFAVCSDCVSK
jgi:hypothetical protein